VATGRELVEWRPPWAPHVVGQIERAAWDHETGMREPQRWVVVCERCRAVYRGECHSGQPRTHVARFARLHLHADPFGPPAPVAASSADDG
jgi:hypothetical protein